MCRLLSENPAKLYGLYPGKGCLEAGSDADIIVYDLEGSDTIRASGQISKSDYAPFEGVPVTGRIESVYLRGTMVVDSDKKITGNTGRYIPRAGFSL